MNMKKIQSLVIALGFTMIISGCKSQKNTESTTTEIANQQSQENTSNDSENNKKNFESNSNTNTDLTAVRSNEVYTTFYEYTQEDINSIWDSANAAIIVLDDDHTQTSGSGVSFSDGTLTINRAGTYVLSGTLSNGQVLIDAGKNDIVRLVLNGVTLHNETGPAIYSPKSEKLILILEEGSKNTVSDGSDYIFPDDENEPYAAIFAQNDLSITGVGLLSVAGNCKHGIRSQDILTITGGEINITAVGDALRGRDGVAIQSGIITLEAEGDGIQSNNADDDTKGFVMISGGTFTIKAGSDGIQAQSALTITGGNFQIITGGGSANAPVREDNFRGGWDGRIGRSQPDSNVEVEEDDSISMKGLKAGKQIMITDGKINIDAEDDAIHSNDSLFISNGHLFIQTGDDGIHADATVEISGGEIEIPVCYEGIEGLSVTISGGIISVTAQDDAINAAGGVDNASTRGGPMGGDQFAVNGDIFVRITGGDIELSASHDGIDSNGNIFVEGGSIKINGPSMGMEGAIDLDGSMIVSGGEFITAGSVLSASQDSTQPVIFVSYTGQQSSGSIISIRDKDGNILLEHRSQIAYSQSGFTSPSFIIGETYSLFIDDEKRVDILLESVTTSISDDGSSYSGEMRGGMPRGGSGMPPRGEGIPRGGGGIPPQGENTPLV